MDLRAAAKGRNGVRNTGKSKEDLMHELAELHKRIAELEGLKRGGNVVHEAALGEITLTDKKQKGLRSPDGKGSLFIQIQEQERKRIANELHDVMGHTLTAIKLSMENIAYKGRNAQNKKTVPGYNRDDSKAPTKKSTKSYMLCGRPSWMTLVYWQQFPGFAGIQKRRAPGYLSNKRSTFRKMSYLIISGLLFLESCRKP